MRYLLDTNTVIYFATDHSKLDRDVISILQDETNLLYMSAESVREIIVAYKNKGFVTKKWKTCNDFLDMIANTPRTPYIESSLSTLQNWGGYLRVSVSDNPSDKIFRALSWLLAATSAFVCAVGGSVLGGGPPSIPYLYTLHPTLYTLHLTPYTLPPICPLSP